VADLKAGLVFKDHRLPPNTKVAVECGDVMEYARSEGLSILLLLLLLLYSRDSSYTFLEP